MKKFLLKFLRFALFLSVGLILLYYAVKEVNPEEFWNKLKNADFIWVALALLASLLGYMSRAYRWKLLIKPLNYNPSFWNVFYAVMIGYTVNFAWPRIGEITRCGILRKTDNVPVDSLLGTVIIERALDMLILISVLVVIFFARINFFGRFLTNEVFNPILEALSKLSLLKWMIVLVAIVLLFLLLRYLASHFSHNPVIRKLKRIYRGVIVGLKTIAKMEDRWVFILHTLIIWTMYFLMTYVLLFAFPSTSQLKPIDGLFLLVVGGLGMAAPVQGGIGTFHLLITLALLLYGIPHADAVAYAVISHESQSIFAIFLGAISFFMIFMQTKRNRKPIV